MNAVSQRTTRKMVAAAVGLATFLASAALASSTPEMPHPAPQIRLKTRATDNATCEKCHLDIAAEWRQSLHHAASTDALYQRELAQDPGPFCRGCHAPEGDTNADLGVGCVTCHVTGASGATLASAGGSSAPHPLLRAATFAGDASCTNCHEFGFPDGKLRRAPLAMQRTETEHNESGHRESCPACHMKRTAGHTDHRFAVSRDDAFVRSAVTIRARRISNQQIELVLSPGNVGHAFPTGDVFRRLRVTAGTSQRFLARHFATRQEIPGVFVRSEISDDRVQNGDRRLVLDVLAATTLVRVIYERADGPSDEMRSSATVDGAIELFRADL